MLQDYVRAGVQALAARLRSLSISVLLLLALKRHAVESSTSTISLSMSTIPGQIQIQTFSFGVLCFLTTRLNAVHQRRSAIVTIFMMLHFILQAPTFA